MPEILGNVLKDIAAANTIFDKTKSLLRGGLTHIANLVTENLGLERYFKGVTLGIAESDNYSRHSFGAFVDQSPGLLDAQIG
jgi:hypothetical protein